MPFYLWELLFGGNVIGPFKSRPAFTGANGSKRVKDQTINKTNNTDNIIKDDDTLQD